MQKPMTAYYSYPHRSLFYRKVSLVRFPLKQQVSAPIQESTHKARNQSEPDDMFEEKPGDKFLPT